MFQPPRCPNASCPRHADPGDGRFYTRRGHYWPKCRAHPVPRFRCKSCGREFSRQTFRMDYRDHRPDLNAKLFVLFASGIGIRQSSRILGLSRHCTQEKFRKIARHLRDLNANLRKPFDTDEVTLQFDEFESYEGRRNTRPLTIPMLVHRDTRFILGAVSAPIRPRGKMTSKRRRAIAEDESRYGPREDRSAEAIKEILARGAELCRSTRRVVFQTDEKSSYPGFARRAFGAKRLEHEQTNSKLARGSWNPLFPINHSEAMARDLTSRLRRESWLVSKKGWCLDLHLELAIAYRNYVRVRFNYDDQTPAQMLGFVREQPKPTQLMTRRQDWGKDSPYPFEASGRTTVAARCAG